MARQKMAIIMVWSAFLAFFSIIVYYNWLIGIDLARLADLPLDVLVESRRVAERLTVLQTRQEESSESRKIAIRRKALLRVILSSVTSSCVYAYLAIARTLFLWALLPSRRGYASVLFRI